MTAWSDRPLCHGSPAVPVVILNDARNIRSPRSKSWWDSHNPVQCVPLVPKRPPQARRR